METAALNRCRRVQRTAINLHDESAPSAAVCTASTRQRLIMDRLSAMMVRASFVWLLIGVIVGGLMLSDRSLPGEWRLWASPTHAHMLFVGWFLQFALGIAFWLLPRRRTPAQPLGYAEDRAFAAVALLNLGLALRVVAEPAARSGFTGAWTDVALLASSLLQVAAVTLLVSMLWPRSAARRRPTSGDGDASGAGRRDASSS